MAAWFQPDMAFRMLLLLLGVLLTVEGVTAYVVRYGGDPGKYDYHYNIDINDYLGVYNWHQSYPEDCAGNQQSPVDIKTSVLRYNPNLQCPVINIRTNLVSGIIQNDGNFVTFTPDDPYALTITNAPYRPGTYVFSDFHVHHGGRYGRVWSRQGGAAYPNTLHPGAEHTLDRYRYDGEVHLVFRNSKYSLTDRSVSFEADGLLGVAIFVQVVNDTLVQDLRFSRYLQEHVSSVQSINSTEAVYVDPWMFLYDTNCGFYTYEGSKTTPYCGESVRWFILSQPIQVTRSAWFELSTVESVGNYVSLYGNYRHEQRLNRRVIETNIPPTPPDGDNDVVYPTTTPEYGPSW